MVAKILVVDDSKTYRELVRAFLDIEGFECTCAASVAEALHAIEHQVPDLVITDLMMTGMDGAELCNRLRLRPETAKTPIIMMTSSRDSDRLALARAAGVRILLHKPFDCEVLVDAVAKCLPMRLPRHAPVEDCPEPEGTAGD